MTFFQHRLSCQNENGGALDNNGETKQLSKYFTWFWLLSLDGVYTYTYYAESKEFKNLYGYDI